MCLVIILKTDLSRYFEADLNRDALTAMIVKLSPQTHTE